LPGAVGRVVPVVGRLVQRTSREPGAHESLSFRSGLETVGPFLIGPAAIVVIGAGIWITVIEEWVAFSDTWIWPSLVLVGVSMVLGMAYFGPEGRRIERIADNRDPGNAEFRQRMDRLLLIGRLDLLLLAVVLWLMVFKPGAPAPKTPTSEVAGLESDDRWSASTACTSC
jgi:hypothetical protein